ncbi:hypothetical protein JKF63_04977 [Porcisia hertigi]|uniref:Uncharacterized protein n=1 Tax=Porcisia hertigi TaxID=2761500 RepID=A0A836LCS6_9TRYP|nr:hypothetical protein JKF63_04977 [Porcisia hertigi]
MALLKFSTGRLCSSTGSCLGNALAPSARAAPHNLKVSHTLGTRQFSLFGEVISHARLLVQCTLSASPSRTFHGERGTAKRCPKVSVPGCIDFECQLSNICRGFPLVLSLRCSTRAGFLIINGASFLPTGALVPEGPEGLHNQLIYHGPHMNQSHLAEHVIGRIPPNSPLDDVAHLEAVFFSAAHCFDGSPKTWFGHTPVHTVKPELADRIAAMVSTFGVDDALAEYMEWMAHAVDKLEREAWLKISKRVLPRVRKL